MQRPVDSSWAIMPCICLGAFCFAFVWFLVLIFENKERPIVGALWGPARPSISKQHAQHWHNQPGWVGRGLGFSAAAAPPQHALAAHAG